MQSLFVIDDYYDTLGIENEMFINYILFLWTQFHCTTDLLGKTVCGVS